jgi:inositol phosphorylceramide mannosyltransferase catalytic subunit
MSRYIELLDEKLIKYKNKIIHQIWFGKIPNRKEAKKALNNLRKYQDSWKNKNKDWYYFLWDYKSCNDFIKEYYPQYFDMYNKYKYLIQKCDAVRYFILHRYGGLYADMDYFCSKPWTDVLKKYNKDFYLVQTPNNLNIDNIQISNSLMYSISEHPFWEEIFSELNKSVNQPFFFNRHLEIMYSTGPAILNKVFHLYKYKYKLNHYPYKLFHPYGIQTNSLKKINVENVYAVHLGKGSWESNDSKIIIFIYKEWKKIIILLVIGFILIRNQ